MNLCFWSHFIPSNVGNEAGEISAPGHREMNARPQAPNMWGNDNSIRGGISPGSGTSGRHLSTRSGDYPVALQSACLRLKSAHQKFEGSLETGQ